MPAPAETPAPLPRRRILILTASAIGVALVILFAGILPAEYNRDPLGLGRLTGTARLWAPAEETAAAGGAPAQRSETVPFREDVIEIVLPFGFEGLEYKVRMAKGSTLVYSWDVPELTPDERDDFWSELHGHTVAGGKTMTVVDYRKAFGGADTGAITAGVDGVHGWFAKNRASHDVTMRIRLAGFYTLIPPGEVGNESGIVPVVSNGAAAPAE